MIFNEEIVNFGPFMDYDIIHYDDYGTYGEGPFPISPIIQMNTVPMAPKNFPHGAYDTYREPFTFQSVNGNAHSPMSPRYPHPIDGPYNHTASTISHTHQYHNVIINPNQKEEYQMKRKLLKT